MSKETTKEIQELKRKIKQLEKCVERLTDLVRYRRGEGSTE